MIDEPNARRLLNELRAERVETEWLEFKEAKHSFDMDELGKHVSALANEANLAARDCGWLVMGVKDRPDSVSGLRAIVGSAFKVGAHGLNDMKLVIAQGTSPQLAFSQVIELEHADCAVGTRVLMLCVPAAPRGMPVAWKGHYHGRDGESRNALGPSKSDRIRQQSAAFDWSANGASHDFFLLSASAVLHGRALYAKKHPLREAEMLSWSDLRFMDELKLVRGSLLTRAALLLFGRSGAVAELSGSAPRLSWRLVDQEDMVLDYEHFSLPLVMAIDAIAAKVRIHQVSILPPGQFVPLKIPNYDDWVLRETLMNCVAHQDYALGGRVMVTESPDALQFKNAGTFIPGTVDQVLNANSAMHLYRNPCLADAMVELGLIDTVTSGIKRIFKTQRDRHFPMPDFEISKADPAVTVRIYGREIDPAFTRALMSMSDLSMAEVVALDHVQKRRPLDASVLLGLRRRELVEGRATALHIAAAVADVVNQRAQYTRNHGLQKPALKQLVLNLIDKFGRAGREEIDATLLSAMPSMLTAQQKANRVKNLLHEMSSKDASIEANRRGVGAIWTRVTDLSKPQTPGIALDNE